jgi:CRP/FNR family transcriptional regulator, cyclic AMP receptor protein
MTRTAEPGQLRVTAPETVAVGADTMLARASLKHMLGEGCDGLADQVVMVDFPAGHDVFVEGDAAEAMYILVRGKVKIGCRAAGGRQKLAAVIGPGDIFGAVSVLDSGQRSANATALTNISVATLRRDALTEWTREHPHCSERLLRVLARRLKRAEDELAELNVVDVTGRVAHRLLKLAQRFGRSDGDGIVVTHDLTQDEMAQLVGASRESVNKAMCEFARRGWITINGRTTYIHRTQPLVQRGRQTPDRLDASHALG